MRTVWLDEDGAWRTTLRGRQVLAEPRINKGTAFSETERRELGVTGLIPSGHVTLDDQVTRVYAQYLRQATDLARNVLLTEVHDRNEVLFYRLLSRHLHRDAADRLHPDGRPGHPGTTARSTAARAACTCPSTSPS